MFHSLHEPAPLAGRKFECGVCSVGVCSTLLSMTYIPTITNTMPAVAPSRPTPWLGSPRIAAHSRPQTAWRPLVVCSSKEGAHNKGESGIHDPIGW